MLNKTIRSVLSLVLVFGLMLGMGGNAIALAISNPASGAIDKIDSEVNATIADLRDTIADLDAQVKEQEDTLEKGEAELEIAEKTLDDAEATLNQAMLDLEKAELDLENAPDVDAKDQALADIADAKARIEKALVDVNEARAKVDEAAKLVEKAKATLEQAEATIADANTAIDNLEKTYEDLRAAVANPEVSLDYVKSTYQELQSNMKTLWTSVENLQVSINDLIEAYAALENAEMEEVEVPEMPAELTNISEKLDNVVSKVATLNAGLQYFVNAAKPYIAKALNVAEETLGITVDFVKANLNKEGAKKVYNWLYNNPDKVCNLVKKFGVYGLDLLVKYGPYALDLLEKHSDLAVLGMKLTAGGVYLTVTLGASVLGYVGDKLDFLADYQDDVVDAARKLYAKYGDEAKALVEVYVDYLNLRERYYNATHADYTIFHDSLYVAIGDTATVAPGSYVDALAELLEIPHMTENLGALDLTVEEAINLVKDNADLIEKADLITLNFTNILASRDMLSALVEDYDSDFTDVVNNTVDKGIDKALAELKERMVAYGIGENHIDLVDRAGELVDRALVELNDRMIAEGMDEATVNMVMEATKTYAIDYITRAAWYPALVDAVYEINPDAQIVIVGTYNDLEGVAVEVGNREIEIGELTKCLIAVANLENLAQAFIGDEAIYVHASAVETVFEANKYEDLNNLGYLMSILNDEMLPSEAGHAYIAEEIFEALNVEYKIWGDVNGDRQVNCRDARLILKYAAGLITEDDLDLTWGDVSGDGKVNSRDARLILQLRAGQIEHFPVCNLSEE